jgi:hypothetical protein
MPISLSFCDMCLCSTRPLLLSFVHFVPRFVLTLIEPIPNAFADLDLYMHCTLAAFAFPVVLVAFSVHYCD